MLLKFAAHDFVGPHLIEISHSTLLLVEGVASHALQRIKLRSHFFEDPILMYLLCRSDSFLVFFLFLDHFYCVFRSL